MDIVSGLGDANNNLIDPRPRLYLRSVLAASLKKQAA